MNGITRGKILKVAKEQGIPNYEKNFSLFDVYGADEAFVTGTFGGLTPVTEVDGRIIGKRSIRPNDTKIKRAVYGRYSQRSSKNKSATKLADGVNK